LPKGSKYWFTTQGVSLHIIRCKDRAVAQAVSRWLPTAAARVRFRSACGFCGGQSSTRAGFLRVLRFPLQIISPISPSSYSAGAGTIGLLVAAVPSGTNWTPPPTIPIKKLIRCNILEDYDVTILFTENRINAICPSVSCWHCNYSLYQKKCSRKNLLTYS
jgi:hypothetical protein